MISSVSSVFVVDNGMHGTLHDRNITSFLSDAVFTDDNVACAVKKLQCRTSSGEDYIIYSSFVFSEVL